jgi:hypothetical protein
MSYVGLSSLDGWGVVFLLHNRGVKKQLIIWNNLLLALMHSFSPKMSKQSSVSHIGSGIQPWK